MYKLMYIYLYQVHKLAEIDTSRLEMNVIKR